ncbi:MAG: 50S ribosome-binding GTPase [Candidatus Woesearchaeota archaeon]|jgi:ribosome biogenesis GTPase A|nr:50S ribosome-binding GTPase [Candidatus Woesearchaeota archaeon]MDP7323452.1 50S ribosome-binding GTPase [Candidatus Woesearchaeota archaeon]MDP7457758.1 50S ribosome-binding GTPase [Candidatus Woesearchaeota archaeon]
MANYWEVVNKVIAEADILLEILDSRNIGQTRNLEIEKKVNRAGKILIYVANKCDLVDKKLLEKETKSLVPSVYVSCSKHYGFVKLRERILIEASKKKIDEPRVGVLGYPNVGKSSVINVLKGKASARTSSESGFTKGMQYIRVSAKILMIDTPGVFSSDNKNALIGLGTVDYGKVRDPDVVVMRLMGDNEGIIENYFGVEAGWDKNATLEEIAIKKKLLIKGGEPDIDRVSRMILKLWQSGKIS